MEQKIPIATLNAGDYFDAALDLEETSRERLFRVVAIRSKTVLAENVAGTRMSFNKTHEARKADKSLWQQLVDAGPSGGVPAFSPREERRRAAGQSAAPHRAKPKADEQAA